jgi:hypothetical protein
MWRTHHKITRTKLLPNPGGHKEDSGPHFWLEFLVLTLNTWINEPLSHKHLRGGKTLTRMKENANGGGEGDGAPSSYLTGLLHNPSFAPGYNWVRPLSPRALWSNPVLSSSDGHRASSSVASSRRELYDAATCHPFLLGTSARVLRLKPVNPPPMVLRPKPPNPLVSSVLHTRPLPWRVSLPSSIGRPPSFLSPARLARPPSWLGQHGHSHVHCNGSTWLYEIK